MADDVRDRIAAAAARWCYLYPIQSWRLEEGDTAAHLAACWGEGIADAVMEAVPELTLQRDEPNG